MPWRLRVYRSTAALPGSQRFGLVGQINGRRFRSRQTSPKGSSGGVRLDKVRFYNIAQGSLEELRYYFILCRDLGYRIEYDNLAGQADQIARL
jgi:four helix bundle protein